jgi:hypothetical protein
MEFDFEAWRDLARHDPEAFEQVREAHLRRAIAQAAPEHRDRLDALQFRLDLERERLAARDPAWLCSSSVTWAGYARLRRDLRSRAWGADPGSGLEDTTASVIDLQAYRESLRKARRTR